MAPKRSSTEVDLLPISTRRENSKRARLSPSADAPSDSSAPPSCSVSEASALRSSPPTSAETRRTSVSSVSDDDDDDDDDPGPSDSEDESESSSDSEDDDDSVADEDDNEEFDACNAEPPRRIIDLSALRKPAMDPQELMEKKGILLTRLRDFMPKLMKANTELANKPTGMNMEDVDEEEAHIEMDLGLGVLEEKRDGERSDSDSEEEDKAEESKDTAVMDKLFGGEKNRPRPSIQELDDLEQSAAIHKG